MFIYKIRLYMSITNILWTLKQDLLFFTKKKHLSSIEYDVGLILVFIFINTVIPTLVKTNNVQMEICSVYDNENTA